MKPPPPTRERPPSTGGVGTPWVAAPSVCLASSTGPRADPRRRAEVLSRRIPIPAVRPLNPHVRGEVGPPRSGFVLRLCFRKADKAWGEAALGHGLADTRFCRARTAQLANRIPSLLGSSPQPTNREPRCARRSDDTDADISEPASADHTEARKGHAGRGPWGAQS